MLYHPDAVREFEEIRDKKTRRSILTAVSILSQLGTDAVEPHAKKVQGAKKLWELRPGGGRVLVRPIYLRRGDREIIILAIGPEAMVDQSGFDAAVRRARDRALTAFGIVG